MPGLNASHHILVLAIEHNETVKARRWAPIAAFINCVFQTNKTELKLSIFSSIGVGRSHKVQKLV